MIHSFSQYVRIRDRRLHEEDDPSSLGPSLGSNNADGGQAGNAGDVRAAFNDLSSALENGLTGPTGPQVLTAIVNAVMGDPQVPERVKNEMRRKVGERWSHLVDLNNSPPGQGPGLGNHPGSPQPNPSLSNVIVPPQADLQGG